MAKLDDPRRLAALHETGVFDALPEPAFDRLAQLAGRMLDVQHAMVTLLDDQRIVLKGIRGIAEPLASTRETLSADSLCWYVIEDDAAFVVEDGPTHARVATHPAVRSGTVRSYLGMPLTSAEGHSLGALCVFDTKPRVWTPADVATLEDLAASASSELQLRTTLGRLRRQHQLVELLHLTSGDASSAASVEEALAASLARICRQLGWPVAHAYLVDQVDGAATLVPHGLWYEAHPGKIRALRVMTDGGRVRPERALPGRVLASARAEWAEDLAHEPSCPRVDAARASGLNACVVVPVVVDGVPVAILEMFQTHCTPRDGALLAVLTDIGAHLGRVFERERTRKLLTELSLQDELTGLRNRRGFLEVARHQLKVANRTERSACLFFGDLNGLSEINRMLGHDAGDEALRAVARLLQGSFRETDVIARLGGDEFVVLALDMGADQATTARERVRSNIMSYNTRAKQPFRLSLSMGCAAYDPRDPRSLEDLLVTADQLLYQQKRTRKLAATSAALPILRV